MFFNLSINEKRRKFYLLFWAFFGATHDQLATDGAVSGTPTSGRYELLAFS
jgi:hypothetical protein